MAYVNEPLGAVGREPAGGSAFQRGMTPGTKEAAAQQSFMQQAQAAGFNRSSTANPEDYLRQFAPASQTTSKTAPVPPAPSGVAALDQSIQRVSDEVTRLSQTAAAPQFAPAPDFNQAASQPATTSTVGAPALPTTTQQAMPPWKIAAIGGGVLVGALLLGRLVKGR